MIRGRWLDKAAGPCDPNKAMTDYVLADEATPSRWAQHAVHPFWIALALVVGGAWLAFPWLVFNAHASGSRSKEKEIGWAIGYFLGATSMALALMLGQMLGLPRDFARLLLLVIVAFKLIVAFRIIELHLRSAHAGRDEFRVEARIPAVTVAVGWVVQRLVLFPPSGAIGELIWAVLA